MRHRWNETAIESTAWASTSLRHGGLFVEDSGGGQAVGGRNLDPSLQPKQIPPLQKLVLQISELPHLRVPVLLALSSRSQQPFSVALPGSLGNHLAGNDVEAGPVIWLPKRHKDIKVRIALKPLTFLVEQPFAGRCLIRLALDRDGASRILVGGQDVYATGVPK